MLVRLSVFVIWPIDPYLLEVSLEEINEHDTCCFRVSIPFYEPVVEGYLCDHQFRICSSVLERKYAMKPEI